MDFQKILHKCGDSGRYQYLLLGLLGYIAFATTVNFFSQNIIGFVPDHWCYHEQLENRSYEEIAAVYEQFGKQASCTRLEAIDGLNVTVSSEACTRWIYKHDYGFKSMNAEMNWVCDNAYKARIGQSLFFVGSLLGTLIFGQLGDRIGRVPALILANQCGFIGDCATTYASTLGQFAICRFISGLSTAANFQMMYILVLEYLSPKLRNVAFNGTMGVCFCLGGLTAPWLSVLTGNWRIYMFCSALFSLLVALFYFVVQESAQWLITRNDVEGAIARLKHIAHFNGKEVPSTDFEEFRRHCAEKRLQSQEQSNARLIEVLRTPRMRRTALLVVFTFMIQAFSYNTIARNVEGLGLSPFIVFSVFALAISPAGLIQGMLQSRLGRKAAAFLAMVFTGLLACAMGVALSFEGLQQNYVLLWIFSVPMRFGMSVSFTCCTQFISELIPTCVRMRGLSAAYVAGSAASFLSPYLIHLGTKISAAPSFILTVVLLTGATVVLMLPETNNRQLPITLEDGEAFGKDESMFSFDCFKRRDEDVLKNSKEELKLCEPANAEQKT